MIIHIEKEKLESALLAQAKNDIRYYLCGICFHEDGNLYATNGHVALSVPHGNEISESVIVSIDKMPTKKYSHAYIDTDTGIVTLTVFPVDDFSELPEKRVGVTLFKMVDGKFPDVKRLIDGFKLENCNQIGFSCKYLKLIHDIGKIANEKWAFCTINLNSNIAAAKVEIPIASSEDKITLIIMPSRI